MSIHQEISGATNGALFRRADLHIHSFGEGGSYDVTDSAMTPEAIVATAVAEQLEIIAITDHNAVGNVRRALSHSEGKPVLVVPGVELSTPQGHLLVYCPTIQKLEAFIGKLDITPDRRFCRDTICQCLKVAAEYDGFGIAAHIDLDSGLEKAHPKYDPFKQEILSCRNLLALEVSRADNSGWFSHGDEHADRRNCAVLRCRDLGHEEDIELAKVMASDAHSLGALGRNAQGAKKLTRFKMESLTFEALRIALLDCAARVRLEDLLPASIPRFVGIRLEGGFLNGQVVQFSRNLTCIIGGRGAGKSTMLESLRVCSGNSVENSLIDSEVWPDAITLLYEDAAGQQHVLCRNKLNEVTNVHDPVNGLIHVPIESYGQGETAETIQHCDKDPAILLRFLDEFIEMQDLAKRDEELGVALLKNQTEIERLTIEIGRIPDIEKAKTTADQQVEALKKQNAGELVGLEQRLAAERRFRDTVTRQLGDQLKSITAGLRSEPLYELIRDLESATLAVGKAECDQVKKLLSDLSGRIDQLSGTLKTELSEYTNRIKDKLKEWTTKEQETQARIEQIRRELEKQKVKLDIAFIRKVTKDATDYGQRLIELKKLLPIRTEAQTQRRRLLQERRDLKARLFTVRQSFATLMNKNLAATVVDYNVSIRFHEGLLSPDFEEHIKTTMDWRTSQVPKAALIAQAMSPFALLDDIQRKSTARLEAIKDANGGKVFNTADAAKVLETLGTGKSKFVIERCRFEDRPEIKVTKTVEHPDGSKTYPVRDFSLLSLGQQQSILLSIMLFSKRNVPLIIDQPEDNLDSEFIYKTLVRSLRTVKEHRQVIIVTHNPNIAVLGDAELIIPLRGASEYAVVRDPGSIDTPATKELVCTILEGSKRAFKRRQDVYGF